MPSSPLHRLRWRLTAWYFASFALILLVLGGGIFVMMRRQFAAELDQSLQQAVDELEQAAAVREREKGLPWPVADAVDELRIPNRRLYLAQVDGTPVRPDTAPRWIREVAVEAARVGTVTQDQQDAGNDELVLRVRADRFRVGTTPPMVAIAIADHIELEDRYVGLLTAFAMAALAALLLLAVAGYFLVGQSIQPIERTMEQMRRFMGDAAHELRTPLSVLRSRAEVALQQPRDGATYVVALQGIDAESQRLGRIVADLLTLAQADAGERPVERQRLFLDDLVLDAADAVRTIGSAKGVAVNMAEFEEAAVEGDAHLLRQLVMILLDNAVKFTPAGGQVIVSVGQSGGQSMLQVRDSGPGIPASQLPHIFERFYRGDVARTRAASTTGGAGLGLSIARWIAEAHDAVLTVTSAEGAGTVATVRFPGVTPPGAR